MGRRRSRSDLIAAEVRQENHAVGDAIMWSIVQGEKQLYAMGGYVHKAKEKIGRGTRENEKTQQRRGSHEDIAKKRYKDKVAWTVEICKHGKTEKEKEV